MIGGYLDDLKSKVGAEKIIIGDSDKEYENNSKHKIKDKEVEISFSKVS